MIILEATSPSGDRVKIDVEGNLVFRIMIAPALPGQGAHIVVRDTAIHEFFKDLEL
jgi:hypothetical protein